MNNKEYGTKPTKHIQEF